MAKVFADDIVLNYIGTDPYVALLGVTVYDTGGNNNGCLDPGETADLTSTLKNIGGVDFSNLSTTLSCTCPHVTITDNSGQFGPLQIDSTKENTFDPYRVITSASTPYGTEADFTLRMQDGSFVDTAYFTLSIGQMAPNDTGLYYAYWSGGPHVHSPVFSWIAIDTSQTTYPGTSLNLGDDAVTQVNLPFTFRYYGVNYTQITVGSDGWIAMGYQTVYDQTNSGIPNIDGPSAMVAGMWDDLDPGNAGQPSDIYYYYHAPTHRFIIEYFRVEHWPSGYHETFEIILHDPAYYTTPTGDGEIIVQYLLGMHETDNTLGIENSSETIGIQYYLDGLYDPLAAPVTDEFAVKYTTYPPDQVPGVEEFGSISQRRCELMICPSIARGSVKISYNIQGSQENAGIKIYDVMGRFVKQFGDLNDSQSTITWNMKDDLGNEVSNGIYFLNLETEDSRVTRKLVVLK